MEIKREKGREQKAKTKIVCRTLISFCLCRQHTHNKLCTHLLMSKIAFSTCPDQVIPFCPPLHSAPCQQQQRASHAQAAPRRVLYDFKLPFFTANHPERVSILEQLPFYTWCYWSVVLNRRNTVVNTGCYHGVVLNRCNTVG